ncbi:hypothetical protein [Spirosoma aerophilum]
MLHKPPNRFFRFAKLILIRHVDKIATGISISREDAEGLLDSRAVSSAVTQLGASQNELTSW